VEVIWVAVDYLSIIWSKIFFSHFLSGVEWLCKLVYYLILFYI